jgi:hypothetical protein
MPQEILLPKAYHLSFIAPILESVAKSLDFRCGSRLCKNSGRKSVGATIDSAMANA